MFDSDACVSCKARDSATSFDFEARDYSTCTCCRARDHLTLLAFGARDSVTRSCEACDSVFTFEARDSAKHVSFEGSDLVTPFPCGEP